MEWKGGGNIAWKVHDFQNELAWKFGVYVVKAVARTGVGRMRLLGAEVLRKMVKKMVWGGHTTSSCMGRYQLSVRPG